MHLEPSKTNTFFSRFEGTRGENTQIFRTQDCSKYGTGRPGIFTSVQKLSDWIRITLNDIKIRNLDRVENYSNINRPMFFVILSMIGSVFLENK